MEVVMQQEKQRVVTDQVRFFNDNATLEKPVLNSEFFYNYVNKEQTEGFTWLMDRKLILDYGCGTGTTIDVFMQLRPPKNLAFVGIDMAEIAVEKAKEKYPQFSFFTVKNNVINQVVAGGCDGAYLMHVLHHSRDHQAIFQEIFNKLSSGGKFFLSDLSSQNPIISFFRSLFVFSPTFLQKKFSDDLVVEGAIPEKYKVDPDVVVQQLKAIGFKVEKIGYGHLFVFFLGWVDRVIPFSKTRAARGLYSILAKFENWLLGFKPFQRRAELFYILCTK